jgi:hypothetical protein
VRESYDSESSTLNLIHIKDLIRFSRKCNGKAATMKMALQHPALR